MLALISSRYPFLPPSLLPASLTNEKVPHRVLPQCRQRLAQLGLGGLAEELVGETHQHARAVAWRGGREGGREGGKEGELSI